MELRKAEAEVAELKGHYEKLLHCANPAVPPGDANASASAAAASEALSRLPPVTDLLAKVRQDRPPIVSANEESSNIGSADDVREGAASMATSLSAREALSSLEGIKSRLDALEAKCTKFRKRLGEKDPVTDAPRYGEKTAARVVDLLEIYDALVMGVSIAFGTDIISSGVEDTPNEAAAVISLRETVQKDEEKAKEAEAIAKSAAIDEAARAASYAQKLEEEERQRREAEESARIMREAELHRQAIEARQQREEEEARAEREAREADRAFVASIVKGPDGVRAQLKALREGCATEPGSFDVAIGALHTLFSQIKSHPDEIKFRRIRRDHPKFVQDIGRHPGGKEILIAAGFTLETLDGVKSFFSREPDLASDMDGWSAWFDGLKLTLDIIEEEMIKG
mmetsp:Transcript_25095/g.54743  ORF Transcript_25095/g.54743 Transcript_25095/m.54743 type:complete len:398 (+) Transcript_25095:52-1245(+)